MPDLGDTNAAVPVREVAKAAITVALSDCRRMDQETRDRGYVRPLADPAAFVLSSLEEFGLHVTRRPS